MKRVLMCLTISLFSSLAYPQCSSNTCDNVYVDRLYATKSGLVFVATSGDEGLLDCNASSGVYTTLDLNDPGANVIYSTLLAAQMANKRVQVRPENGTDGCLISYVTLDKQ